MFVTAMRKVVNAGDEMNSETFDALTKSMSTTVGTRTDLGSRQPGFTENHVTLDPPHLTWGACNSSHLTGGGTVVRTTLGQDLRCFGGRSA